MKVTWTAKAVQPHLKSDPKLQQYHVFRQATSQPSHTCRIVPAERGRLSAQRSDPPETQAFMRNKASGPLQSRQRASSRPPFLAASVDQICICRHTYTRGQSREITAVGAEKLRPHTLITAIYTILLESDGCSVFAGSCGTADCPGEIQEKGDFTHIAG